MDFKFIKQIGLTLISLALLKNITCFIIGFFAPASQNLIEYVFDWAMGLVFLFVVYKVWTAYKEEYSEEKKR